MGYISTGPLGNFLLVRYRRLRDKVLPVMTRRRGVYEWFIKQVKILFGLSARSSLGETLVLKCRRTRNRLLPWYSHNRKVFQSLITPIKRVLGQTHFKPLPLAHIRKRIKTADNKPLISVVIPVYDRTDILRECIESILNQTYPNFELLLVCDGSPPETLEVVNSYESHPKVRVFKYKDNSGNAVRGRNKGILEARGPYLAFIDSDDIAKPHRLEMSYLYAEKYNADVIYGAYEIKKEKGLTNPDITDEGIAYSPEVDYNKLKFQNDLYQSTVMVKTDVLRKAGGLKPEMRYAEDYELWLRLAYLGYKFKSVPEVLTIVRIHPENLVLRFKRQDTEEHWIQIALTEHKNIPQLKAS